MILWHLATALFGFRWVFRDPGADLRWLMAGALGPDVVDIPAGTLIWAETFASSEVFGHSLIVAMGIGVLALLFTRRPSRIRRNLMVFMVGWLMHLLADGIWLDAQVFWWPFGGWSFPAVDLPFWPGAFSRAWADPWRWLLEGVGVAYLWAVARKAGILNPDSFRRFLGTGRLER